MSDKNAREITFAVLGLLVTVVGLYLVKSLQDPDGIMRALPYVLVGVGCGAFGHNLGEFINNRVLQKNPDIARKAEIEQKDERNVAIANKSKAKAFDIMLYIYAAMMLAFALAQADMMVVIILAASYLSVVCTWIYFVWKHDSEM